MKIALAQLNYTIGDFELNTSKIITAIEKAKTQACDLIVFSELAVCAYIPHDLLEQKDFIDKVYDNLEKIKDHSYDIGVLVGTPLLNQQASGKKLYNAAVFMEKGEIKQAFYKTLLPTYDIFDDYRYFEPNNKFELLEFKGKKIAVTICEDLWDKQEAPYRFAKEKQYKISPLEKLSKLSPDFVINIAGSPFSYNQEKLRHDILANNAKKYGLPVVYVNQTGANTELIYDGGSRVLNAQGQVIKQLKHFEEDIDVFDTVHFKSSPKPTLSHSSKIENIHKALVLGVRDYVEKMGFTSAVIGLSGGVDSAVTAALVTDALGPDNVHGVLMPSQYSSEHSITDAEALAENLNIPYHIVPIKPGFESVKSSLSGMFEGLPDDVTEENMQARIRGLLLMAISNKFGHMVINTSNKSEAAVGYTTLYGDMNGGLSVLGDVYKTDVFALSEYINREKVIIPRHCITKPPSAELRPDQKDEDSLPPYEVLDGILFEYIEQKLSESEIIRAGFDKDTVKYVIALVNNNEYKRFQAPPVLPLS
ncbi:MAG: NAD+ synthase [Candidatus Delongbacteria bacterium]|nr:NAD+ synthase [Candidatus Delongbacteria bacterium]